MLHDRHNNPNLITMEDLERAARAGNMTVQDAAENIADSLGLSCRKGSEGKKDRGDD